MIDCEVNMAQRLFSAGFPDVVRDAFVRYGRSGIWVGEWSVAETGLARVISPGKASFEDHEAAHAITDLVVGARELDAAREARIADAARATVDRYRRNAVAFPGQYVLQTDIVLEADGLAGGSASLPVDGAMIRQLPLSRVERVVLETLGFSSPTISDMGEIIEQGVNALNGGQATQGEFADGVKSSSWLFQNASPADYRQMPPSLA